jgi:hypothetical protein
VTLGPAPLRQLRDQPNEPLPILIPAAVWSSHRPSTRITGSHRSTASIRKRGPKRRGQRVAANCHLYGTEPIGPPLESKAPSTNAGAGGIPGSAHSESGFERLMASHCIASTTISGVSR